MSGSKSGGRKAYLTIIERHGKDFYREIGRKGGKLGGGKGGFSKTNSRFAAEMGRIGGKKRVENARSRKLIKEMYDEKL